MPGNVPPPPSPPPAGSCERRRGEDRVYNSGRQGLHLDVRKCWCSGVFAKQPRGVQPFSRLSSSHDAPRGARELPPQTVTPPSPIVTAGGSERRRTTNRLRFWLRPSVFFVLAPCGENRRRRRYSLRG